MRGSRGPNPEDDMPTLEKRIETRPQAFAMGESLIESEMRRLGPSLARTVAETAGAFFNSPATLEAAWAAPRLPEGRALRCSQENIGEKYGLLCDLSADMGEYARLFPAGVSDSIKLDAYCELANCICGAILADADFADEFGYLIPCVPCSGAGRLSAGTRSMSGAFRLKDAWIRFSLTVQAAVPAATSAEKYRAASGLR